MKLAIIGASTGQLPLCLKAKEMGITTICFAWKEGAICEDYVDKFYPISVVEKEQILEICREEGIDGVVSNTSDILAEIVAYISEQMELVGNNYDAILKIKNKHYVRSITSNIKNLKQVKNIYYQGDLSSLFFPCIVKPTIGSSKKGVYFAKNIHEFEVAINYAHNISSEIMVEEYIGGSEISVEVLSYHGKHNIIQITDKEVSGPPHFVELAHHQPADLEGNIKDRIKQIVVDLLDGVSFKNGASHIELKIDNDNNIYLIEINPRGGGDEISNRLTALSTDFDYLKEMIDVALNHFEYKPVNNIGFSGIYFLCKQTEYRLPLFENSVQEKWLVDVQIKNITLNESKGNYNRDGYLIYQADYKI